MYGGKPRLREGPVLAGGPLDKMLQNEPWDADLCCVFIYYYSGLHGVSVSSFLLISEISLRRPWSSARVSEEID